MKIKYISKSIAFIATMFVLLQSPNKIYAQKKSDGFFNYVEYNRNIGNDLTLQNFGVYYDLYGLGLQNFGEGDPSGLDIQNFGDSAPLGEGLTILTFLGLCYYIRKRKLIKIK